MMNYKGLIFFIYKRTKMSDINSLQSEAVRDINPLYEADTGPSGKAVTIKSEILRLSAKIQVLETQIAELRVSLPPKCPQCHKYSEPILRSYYDLNPNSKINGIKKMHKLCPCCRFIYLSYNE